MGRADVTKGGVARMHTEGNASLAERCAARLQEAILDGDLRPGEQLNEATLVDAYGVSRNTLREAFRLLTHDMLVEHVTHRGVFVATVDAAEAAELYAMRRHLQLGCLRELAARAADPSAPGPDEAALAALVAAAEEGRRWAREHDWNAVGGANNRFHLALVGVTGNRLAVATMRMLMTQTRLRFLTLGEPQRVHEGYVEDNAHIAGLVAAGEYARAHAALELYLLRAERELA